MQAAFAILGHATSVEVLFAEYDIVRRLGSKLRTRFLLGFGGNGVLRLGGGGSLSGGNLGCFVRTLVTRVVGCRRVGIGGSGIRWSCR
jgi:hypothetical protein